MKQSHPLSLDHMTVFDVGPVELITIAGQLEVPLVSVFVQPPVPGTFPLVAGEEVIRATQQRLQDTGVGIYNLECFNLAPDVRIETFRGPLELGARLGAKSATAINFMDPDEARVTDNFAALCELGREYALNINIEFISMGFTRTLADALKLVTRAAQPNGRVLIDCLHFVRTFSTLEELSGIDPRLLGYLQICDGPLATPADLDLIAEATNDRQLPGRGEFPLRQILEFIPTSAPIAIEVPSSVQRGGLPPLEWARSCMSATRSLLD